MKFFRKAIRKGMPWSTPGMADGLMGLERAIGNISIVGGRTTWSSDGVPKLIPGDTSGATMARFEVIEEHGDYLMCAKIASLDASQHAVPQDPEGDLVPVLKPWLLRNTPFDGKTRDGISYETMPTGYTYDTGEQNIRKATEGSDEEWQTLTPSYSLRDGSTAGEVIRAFYHSVLTIGTLSISLTDINTAGRSWAVTDEPEAT